MLEKSLPFFRETQPNQPKQLGPQSSSQIYSSGPNLLLQEEVLPVNYFYTDKFLKTFRQMSFFITILFGLMLTANFVLNLKLESQRKMINQLADEVGQYTLVEKQAIDVARKTKFYENTLSQRYILGDKSRIIFSSLDPSVVLKTTSIAPEKFTMTIEVATPVSFAKLINTYLESDRIASITLRSADLRTTRNVYEVTFEGTYK